MPKGGDLDSLQIQGGLAEKEGLLYGLCTLWAFKDASGFNQGSEYGNLALYVQWLSRVLNISDYGYICLNNA